MKKTIYLHVGSGKTGTTSIQKTLFENINAMKKHGVLYLVESDISHSSIFSWDGNMKQNIEIYFKKLQKLLYKNDNFHTIIVSSENMMGLPVSILEMIKFIFKSDNIEFKIVAYIRNQINHLPSHYLQKVKDPFQDYKGDMNSFFESYKHIYGNEHVFIMNNYTSVFGKENIIVRIYDRSLLVDGDSAKDFIKTLGLDSVILKVCNESNISLIPELSSLIKYIDDSHTKFLDKSTNDFAFRQNTLMPIFLEISKMYKAKRPFKEYEYLFNKIEFELKSSYSENIFTRLNENIERVKKYILSGNKYQLINNNLKYKVLNYYEQSNIIFSDMFLTEKEKKVFLKYYNKKIS